MLKTNAPCFEQPESPVPEISDLISHVDVALKNRDLQGAYAAAVQANNIAEGSFNYYHADMVAAIEAFISVMEIIGDRHNCVFMAMKALFMQVNLTGLDSFQVVKCHKRLAQLLVADRQPKLALKHLQIARYLIVLLGGPNHPELVSVYELMGLLVHGVHAERKIMEQQKTKDKQDDNEKPDAIAPSPHQAPDLEGQALTVALFSEARRIAPSMFKSTELTKTLGDIFMEVASLTSAGNGPSSQIHAEYAAREYERAHLIYKQLLGEESEPVLEVRAALVAAKRALTERRVQQAIIMKKLGQVQLQEQAQTQAEERLKREKEQAAKGEKSSKRTYNYRELFKNHSRIRR